MDKVQDIMHFYFIVLLFFYIGERHMISKKRQNVDFANTILQKLSCTDLEK